MNRWMIFTARKWPILIAGWRTRIRPSRERWIEAENKITFKFLDAIPQRSAIKARLKELWDYERYGVPFKEQARYFFTRNSGLQNQSVIYTTDNFAKLPRELIDPNALSKDGTVALGGSAVSDDAKLFAYGLATAGSDWQQWKVCDVATGKIGRTLSIGSNFPVPPG